MKSFKILCGAARGMAVIAVATFAAVLPMSSSAEELPENDYPTVARADYVPASSACHRGGPGSPFLRRRNQRRDVASRRCSTNCSRRACFSGSRITAAVYPQRPPCRAAARGLSWKWRRTGADLHGRRTHD